MTPGESLSAVCQAHAARHEPDSPAAAVGPAVLAMAGAAVKLADRVASPALEGRLGAATGDANSDGDRQRRLDIVAEDLFSAALRQASVACYLSEEVEAPVVFDPAGLLAVAIDPLDGSSNIDVNAPIGTIFSIFPTVPGAGQDAARAFRQTGRAQIAAGFFIYGPQTALVISFGQGTQIFGLDRSRGEFVLVEAEVTIPTGAAEFAINASNLRRWREPVRGWVEACLQGAGGPHGVEFNMRWAGSLVADAYRIFMRGGIFLYPADDRDGYGQGRLRLMYEANPVAFLAEQAGGAATDGLDPILDRVPTAPHERAPLIMGSADEVERVRRYHLQGSAA